jgi:hypothetical protein
MKAADLAVTVKSLLETEGREITQVNPIGEF